MGPFLSLISTIAMRIPWESVIFRPRDKVEALEAFAASQMVAIAPPEKASAPPGLSEKQSGPAGASEAITASRSSAGTAVIDNTLSEQPTAEETTDVLKSDLAKELYKLELDLARGLKINGKACDCAEFKHVFKIEAVAEELVPREPDNKLYRKTIAWFHEHLPMMTKEASASGLYDDQYPHFAHDVAQFRKGVVGSLSVGALLTKDDKDRIRAKALEFLDESLA